MKVEVIEEVGTTRIGKYTWEDPDGMTGGSQLYASENGKTWHKIDSYSVEKTLTGATSILANFSD